MQRHCGNVTSCCFQRCVGMDAANAVFSVTYECDQAHGTDYHRRFRDFWAQVQSEDLVVDGAMTDPKGDRGKRPGPAERPGPLPARRRPPQRRRRGPRRQAAPDRHAELARDHRHAHHRHASRRGGLGGLLRRAHERARHPLHLRPPGQRHPQAGAAEARRRQRALRRPGGDDGLRGRVRARRSASS